MLKGWDDNTMFNLTIQRQVATIIAETTNRSMGGKGVVDYIMKAFPLPHDKAQEVAEMTPDKITSLIDRYNEHMRQKRLRNGGTT